MTQRPPKIVLLVDRPPLPRWQTMLCETLGATVGARVVAIDGAGTPRLGLAARMYAWLDVRVSRRGAGGAVPAPHEVDALSASLSEAVAEAEVVVDLTRRRLTDPLPNSSLQILTVAPQAVDPDVLLAMLAAGMHAIPVNVDVRHLGVSAAVEQSNVSVPRLSLVRSSERVGWRTAALLQRAIDRLASGDLVGTPAPPSGRPQLTKPRTLDLTRLLGTASLSIARNATTESEWRVAWGRRDARDPFVLPKKLTFLEAPPGHFFADPFLAQMDDRTYLFFEDFDAALGRATIAVTELGTAGAGHATVLSADHHLSYPFVFSHESTWYMIPESAEAERITLYRCDEFPDRWVEDTVLLDGVAAYDSTLLWFEQRWWLFYSSGTEGSSFDDELHVLYSPTLRGPYTAHPANPVRSDAVGARPAGCIVFVDGRLLRPGQDGAREYGAGIVVNEIVTLTPASYVEREIGRVRLPQTRNIRGLHTINTTDLLIVVDTKHRVPRGGARLARGIQRLRSRQGVLSDDDRVKPRR